MRASLPFIEEDQEEEADEERTRTREKEAYTADRLSENLI